MQGMKFEELRQFYIDHFSLGCINSDLGEKLVLIGLICKLTKQAQEKKPGVTHYQIITSLNKDIFLPENFIVGLAIMCEDFSYHSKKFPDFGIEQKNIISTVKNIMKSYLPF